MISIEELVDVLCFPTVINDIILSYTYPSWVYAVLPDIHPQEKSNVLEICDGDLSPENELYNCWLASRGKKVPLIGFRKISVQNDPIWRIHPLSNGQIFLDIKERGDPRYTGIGFDQWLKNPTQIDKGDIPLDLVYQYTEKWYSSSFDYRKYLGGMLIRHCEHCSKNDIPVDVARK